MAMSPSQLNPCIQFTAKTLNRQAKKAQKDENVEKSKVKKVYFIDMSRIILMCQGNQSPGFATRQQRRSSDIRI